jgi:type I restriction enzyme M protein
MAYTEWTFEGRVLSWIREFIKEKNLPFDGADQEIIVEGRKRPDILIWKNRNLREAALLLSLKGPYRDAWDAADDALIASSRAGTRYFATWNVNRFFMWDRYRRGNLYDQLVDASEVTTIKHWREMDRVEESIRSFLRDFLIEFTEVYFERKLLPPLPPDERFIFRLRSAIDTFSIPAFYKIKDEWNRSKAFKEGLRRWFGEQGWTFTRTDENFEKIARQYVYLLVNKIVFYYILRLKNSQLPKIHVPLGVGGEQFREILQSFFNQALGIDYETIFAADFLDAIPLPDDLTAQLRNFIDRVGEYDFSRVGYEVIGRVFERLIPERERHKLGQYFTRSDVVDLIVGFCVRSPDAKVLDPACGAGTFLVRSYARKKFLNPHKPHEELLKELYGIDIAKFPAHLTTINLAARDLSVEENYPRVLCEDFFGVSREKRIPILKKEYVEKFKTEGLDLKKLMVEIPPCDAVVMNPPYTRQEEMESLVFPEGYRTTLQGLVSEEWNGFHVGKRSSIYSYFFFHGGLFPKEKERLGLITSNSWLDVDYGKYLKRLFLENFRTIAIIESKVERWFEDADINTAITILERCSDEKARNANFVRFIKLKKPLRELVPPTNNEAQRWSCIESLIKTVNEKQDYYEDESLIIFPKRQKDLYEEGYGKEEKQYVGSKWGKYIKAPHLASKLDSIKNRLVKLGEAARVKFGCHSGINDFFYSDSKRRSKWSIEKKFLKPLLRTTRQAKSISIDTINIDTMVFACSLSKEELRKQKALGAISYIDWGSQQVTRRRQQVSAGVPWPKVESVKDRRPGWWSIPRSNLEGTNLFIQYVIYSRFIAPISEEKILSDACFHRVFPKKGIDPKVLCGFLNSSFCMLSVLLAGRETLGQGALKFERKDANRLLIPNPRKISREQKRKVVRAIEKISSRSLGTIFEELGSDIPENVSLDKVKPDRRKLDELIMGEILGLNSEEQLEVYKVIVDLVKARIDRAKSVVKQKKKVKGIDVDALVEDIFEEVGKGRLMKFPDDYIEGFECREISVPEGEAKVGQDLYGFYVKIDGKEIRCKSPYEARYIQYAVLNGKTTVKIFKDEKLVTESVRAYASLLREVKKRINEYLESTIPDRKLRKRIKDDVWKKLTGQK